jgi:Tol biopolymer transport system component
VTPIYAVTGFVVAVVATLASPVSQRPSYDLLVVQVPVGGNRQSAPMDRYVDGARIVLLPANGAAPVPLTPDFVSACDPDVSFDGTAILFAGKRRAGDSWQIWRMNNDGSEKIQVTQGAGHSVAPVFAGNRFYLDDPEPTPQIIFARTEGGSTSALYGTDLEGTTLRRLTFNLRSDFAPDVLRNGRIVFTSVQRSGTSSTPTDLFALMAVNVDGTDLMPFYGSHTLPRYKNMVHASDFDDRVYFVESDRTPWLRGGDLAVVSQRRPLHSYRRISNDADGVFHSPSALPDGGLIASYRRDVPSAAFALYDIDAQSGRRRGKIFEQSGWHTIDVQVLAARPAVPGRSNWLIPGATTGVFYSLDSYRTSLGNADSIAPGDIKYVRVIEGVRPTAEGDAKRLLGVAPVETDGSFHVRVPAETPVTFQLLDKDYVALRAQNAWTWVMGNENRGCIGCHEDRELSPPNRLATAVTKPPVELTLPPVRRRTVDYRHDIAPIVRSTCATEGCHVAARAVPDLSEGSRALGGQPSPAYRTLVTAPRGERDTRYVVPGAARASPLIQLLLGRNGTSAAPPPHDLLPHHERILFVEWVDMGAPWDSRASGAVNPPEMDAQW